MKLSLDGPRRPNNVHLDDVDERILWELVRDARLPNKALAEIVGISPSNSLMRVRALREAGVLRSSHAQVDFGAVGLPIQAMIAVRLRPQARGDIRSYASRAINLASVINIFFLGGPDDFLIHVGCTTTSQLRDFVATELSMDPAVASTQTNVVFDHLIGAQHMDHFSGFADMRTDAV